MGCWSCKHWSIEKAQDLWWNKAREAMLKRGLEISLRSPQKEEDPRVMNIRKMVPEFDVGLQNGVWGTCAINQGGGDFIASTFLCNKWSGATGASVARGGEAPDLLPQEILEKIDKEN